MVQDIFNYWGLETRSFSVAISYYIIDQNDINIVLRKLFSETDYCLQLLSARTLCYEIVFLL